MRLAPCAPPPGLRYDALVDAPVTSIASSLFDEVRASEGAPATEPLWCAYWDQSEELGPYYLYERTTDAWYRVQVDGPYEMPERPRNDLAGRTARIDRGRVATRVKFVGRWGRGASAPVLCARGASKPRPIGQTALRVPNDSVARLCIIASRLPRQ